ncbi:MAG: Ni/Fe hydrogenase subunit alpha [Pseudomonadota bacterium]
MVGVVGQFPEVAAKGIRLRKFGQEIIKALGGKKVHPAFSAPGGVTDPLPEWERDRLLAGFREAHETWKVAVDLLLDWVSRNLDQVRTFGNFSSHYLGLVDENGRLNLYDGRLRMTGPEGKTQVEFNPADYLEHLSEHVEPWSYMKFPFYKIVGWPEGVYRVGPLARLYACDGLTTPRAAAELEKFKKLTENELRGGSLLYHYARLIELLYALEKAEELLKDGRICRTEVKVSGAPLHREGVGVIEAPRGTLIHHYWVDKNGAMEKANLIVATGHNNAAMNRAVSLVAKEYIKNGEVREGLLNRVEGAIRCYDPCLSCATHALGRMPLTAAIFGPKGELLNEVRRD